MCVCVCVCKMPFCPLVAGSVGRNLANKPNVYVSSSAGARWKEVSTESDTDDKKNTACKTESQAARLSKAFQHFTIHFFQWLDPGIMNLSAHFVVTDLFMKMHLES